MRNSILSTAKVLIISHNSLSLTANNGKTLESIFDCFPSESIAQLFFQTEVPSSNKFKNFFRISDLDIVRKLPSLKFDFGDKIESEYHSKQPNVYGDSSWIVNKIKKLTKLKSVVRTLLYSFNIEKGNKLNSWLDEFNPTAVFVLGGESAFLFRIALRISQKRAIPLHLFFTDDYIFNSKSSCFNVVRINYLNTIYSCVKYSKSCFCISDKMSQLYKEKFLKDFNTLNNAVDLNKEVVERINYPGKPIRFVYAGGLTLGRDLALLNFCQVISLFSLHNKGLDVGVDIYSANEIPSKIRNSLNEINNLKVSMHGFKPALEMDFIYNNADFLLHVESSEPVNKSKTYLSISTKISECLVSKRCLIAFGPSDLASMELIKDNEIGVQLDSELPIYENEKVLSSIIFCDKKYKQVVDFGYDYATRNFSKKSVQDTLLNQL
ncbi:hypothetical protein [Shewanella glacialipiscicola]|uniref:hypothetical protein n=1 Tax=Shewanella glacialipiscicola TaxID=614069 RepID=UPI003D793D9B